MNSKWFIIILLNVLCSVSTGTLTAGIVLASNSVWKYNDSGVDLGVHWRNNSYNDAGWQKGKAELGFGDSPTTLLQPGSICYYFRKTFNIDNPIQYSSFIGKIRRDDGIVIYLNGKQIFRNNMPSGSITYSTPALMNCTDDGDSMLFVSMDASDFLNGSNLFAVEIHSNNLNDADLTFEFELESVLPGILPVILRGPYLQSTTTSSCVIKWRTDIETDSKVGYGINATSENTIKQTEMVLDHSVRIDGLLPNTKYKYYIGSTAITLGQGADHFLTTAPLKGSTQPLRIWAIGDFGNGSVSQEQVLQSYLNLLGNKKNDMWIWLGDNAYYNGTDSEYTSNVFNKYHQQFKNWNFYPAIGNHDYGGKGYLSPASLGVDFPYFDIFNLPNKGQCGGVPSGTEKYYSYDWGNVHFIALDSYGAYNSVSSPMYNWLLSDLQLNASKWIIAYWHHPPFSKGTHNSDGEVEMVNMRQNIVPLLERFGVDLVLTGHSHTYERSYFMHGHYGLATTFDSTHIIQAGDGLNAPYVKNADHNGTVYAVCGVGGQTSAAVSSDYPHNAMVSSISSVAGSAVIDISSDTLHFRFLRADGMVGDEFFMVKDGSPRYEWNNSYFLMDPRVFPNPSNGIMSVFPGNPIYHQLSVYNQIGELVFSAAFFDFKTIDFQFLGKGIFQFVWREGSSSYTQKVLIN